MSQANTPVDPRSNIAHPLDTGQVYEDERSGDELVLVFLSEDAALLKDDDRHRLETRKIFESNVGSGRYDLQANADGSASTSSKLKKLERLLDQYKDESGRTANHKAEALSEAIELIENNGRPDDNDVVPFEEIDGIGSKAASALRASGLSTKGDVRSSSRDEIVDTAYMGEKNTDALLQYVEDDT